jgi:ribosomal protein S14
MSDESEKVYHIRRCHVCGHTNESHSQSIRQCSNCGKHLAPFYFFDESRLEGIPLEGPHWSEWKLTYHTRPLYGFSHYWSEDVTE